MPNEQKPLPQIPNTMEISGFWHCGKCLAEKPGDISPRDYAKLEAGLTPLGFQLWCVRHECNVVHVSFDGFVPRANTTITKTTE